MRRIFSCLFWAVQLSIHQQWQVAAAGQWPSIDTVSLPTKSVIEYPLPASIQTHEIIAINDNLLLLSQQPDGSLVKVVLDDEGRPIGSSKWLVTSPFSGLHGLYLHSTGGSSSGSGSNVTTGPTVWATLQFDNQILRIDVGSNDINSAPTIIDTIPVPSPAYGPHGILESGGNLWIACKDSSHVVRISTTNTNDYEVFAVSGRPIFTAVHPTSGDVFASLDLSSKIWHKRNGANTAEEIDIPATAGTTPVGLIAGSDGNCWVALLGNTTSGTGTFGRINGDASIDWFTMTSPIGKTAGLIHMAFDQDPSRFWLLGSSTVNPAGVNAVFTVSIDESTSSGTAHPRIKIQNTIMLPTQRSWTHRMISHRGGLYVTEYVTSTLAHVRGAVVNGWPVNEGWDQSSAFGLGLKATVVHYNNTA